MESKATVLMIDDERMFLEACVEELNIAGFQAVGADNVLEAIRKIESTTYDVVIVDLRMPSLVGGEMGGLDLIEKMKAENYYSQVIVITGFGSVELAKTTFKRGVFDFLEKSQTKSKELIDCVRKALSYKEDLLRRSGNPFVRRTGVAPRVFGGRIKELDFFESRLEQAFTTYPEHFIVLGDWGIGKSALLQEFKRIAQNRGYAAAVVPMIEFEHSGRVMDVVETIIQGVFANLPYGASHLKKFHDYIESLGITVMGVGLNFTKADSKAMQPHLFFKETFEKLWRDVREENDLLIVLIDDIQYVLKRIPEALISIKQVLASPDFQDMRILFVLSCTQRQWFELVSREGYQAVGTFFLNRLELPLLSKSEVEQTIASSLQDTGVFFDPEIVDMVFEHANGHPFETQVLCSNLFESQIQGKVDETVWPKCLDKTLSELGQVVFEHWLGTLTEEEVEICKAISLGQKPLNIKKLKSILLDNDSKINLQEVGRHIHNLREKGMLRDAGPEAIEFKDSLFKLYVSRFK
ncbi:MAG: response regulator [Desulfovibrionales bacterium]|nr:response regulator [Desulfovibrionales bacterium]